MTKSISMTIAGTKFKVASDAEQVLNNYLQSLKTHFGNYADGAEIYADFEIRIAEKLQELISGDKDVISEADVTKVISSLGKIDDFKTDTSDYSIQERIVSKFKFTRLRRDTDNQKIAGVCAGIANYIDIDPVVVRVVFCTVTLLLLFTASPFVFFPILLYLALWVSMPEAKTIADKLESKGEKVTVAAITKAVSEANESPKSVTKLQQVINIPIDVISRVGRFVIDTIKLVAPWTARFSGLGLFITTLFGITAITAVAGIFITNPDSEYIGVPVLLLVNKDYQTLYLLVALIAVVSLIPLLAAFILSISMMRLKNMFKGLPSLVGLALWIVSIVGLVIVGVGNYGNVRNALQLNPGVFTPAESQLANVSGDFTKVEVNGDIHVDFIAAETSSASVVAMNRDLEDVKLEVVDGVLQVNYARSTRNLCLLCIYYRPQLQVKIPVLTSLTLNNNSVAYVQEFKNSDVAFDLEHGVQLFSNSDFSNITLQLVGRSYASLRGSADSVVISATEYSQINTLDLKANKVDLKIDGFAHAYVFAKEILNIEALNNSAVYYTTDGELIVNKEDSAGVFPYRHAIGQVPNAKELMMFLQYERDFSDFSNFMSRAALRGNSHRSQYEYRLAQGEMVVVQVDMERDLLESVVMNGVELLK